ncbi:MAG: TolC family protein [Bacteroidales bacterium]|nr:TolC family protein [Bacteroidales bacterium]
MKKSLHLAALLLFAVQLPSPAQTVLTLEECRDRAVSSSKALEQARIAVEMADYDKKIALANYFPNISATGTYMYNNRNLSLISDSQSESLRGIGDRTQAILDQAYADAAGQIGQSAQGMRSQLEEAIKNDPKLMLEYALSPMWKTVFGILEEADLSQLKAPEIAGPVNAIGREIDDALHFDNHNVYAAAVSLQQPVFVGGKIIYSNQMAKLARELETARYDQTYADVIVDVDEAYWQIVSIAAKKRLADSYADLLHTLEADVQKAVTAGVMTESDALQIRVKVNEGEMLRTKAGNGLTLSKMLLCKRIGLPLDSAVTLADEQIDLIPQPVAGGTKSLDNIFGDRPETRSLELASKIYDRKAKIARADLMPKVVLTANYLVSNPNLYNGYSTTWNGGMFSAGVLVSVPIFHGMETANKYRKARAEVALYESKLQDARELITLQVSQQRKLLGETRAQLETATSNLEAAEENLRAATLGFEAGVVTMDTVLSAQTAWLQAHSECIDAGTELQLAASRLNRAEGSYLSKK